MCSVLDLITLRSLHAVIIQKSKIFTAGSGEEISLCYYYYQRLVSMLLLLLVNINSCITQPCVVSLPPHSSLSPSAAEYSVAP